MDTSGVDELIADLDALARARVLVLGDVMLDRFIYGTVERVSPEAPIPVLHVTREVAMLGGAGNVLRNLAALGVRGTLLGMVGDDEAGRTVAALAAAEVDADCRLVVQPGRATTIKDRYIAAGQHLLRADREMAQPVADTAAEDLVAALGAAFDRASGTRGAVVLSDYGKGVLTPQVIARVIARARAAGWPVVVDPKGRDYGIYAGADVLTPNRRELAEATGLATSGDDDVVAACRAALEAAGARAIVATRSERGLSLVRREDAAADSFAVDHFPAEAREVFDVSGAGDTVAAVLAAGLAAGLDLPRAARLANVAAGIVVGKLGTAVAGTEEIRHALHTTALHHAGAKVADVMAMREAAARWRRAGLRIGFTNGCFDLLHPGHVSLLAQARGACDRLVVGLNSDASVRRLKGPGRPIQPEAARAAVLASLASVDLVVIFAEETPLALIEALRPDVLVKGADYRLEDVVGADLVQSYGGRVVLADLVPGYSTTATIRKLSG
ncbi:MAG: D-glycero-beta-D-manno-heptose-7-phosphate kinase [Alphaproteobacteria bacterium]|nr:MAG: D-glycero-beta-D-manno-heptose-7-phosphate kinase [Alphaproteobacteria bacterium]